MNDGTADPNASDDDDDDESVLQQVRVIFKLAAECTDRSLQVPSDVIAVPADAGRKQLSAVLNHLLGRSIAAAAPPPLHQENNDNDDEEDDEDAGKLPAIPFECIVGRTNRLLRTGIEREARRSGVTLEEAIPVTYFPAQTSPETSGESEQQPDWISSVSYIPSRKIVCAGCYDGSILVLDETTMAATTKAYQAHQGPIHCLSTTTTSTKTTSNDGGSMTWIATGSMDHTVRLHTIHTSSQRKTNDIRWQASCMGGHTSAVTSVDLNRHAMTLASGDWDGTLCLWDFGTDAIADNDAHVSKKSKTASTVAPISPPQTAPYHTLSPKTCLRAHSSNISGISWGNHAMLFNHSAEDPSPTTLSRLITGSWDHSLKVWDMQRQDCLLTLNVSRVVSCLDTSYHSDGVVATGHPDCTVRLWDTRTTPEQGSTALMESSSTHQTSVVVVADTTFRPSHKEWITAVQWSRTNAFHLASTSHDGTVKLWDIRSPLPLHTYRAFPKKAKGLCVSYGGGSRSSSSDDGGILYVGGTDCAVKQLRCAGIDKEHKQ